MPTVRSNPAPLFFIAFLLIAASPPPSQAISVYPFLYARQLLSLSRSILTRVADLRASRGHVARSLTDLYGAASDMNEWIRALTELTRSIAASPSPSQSLSSYPFLDLSRSILIGVADLRAARGDVAGAQRARALADLYGVALDMDELMRELTELTRLESAAERSAWVARNYQNVRTVSKSLSAKLLKAFGQSGLVREVMETVQKEVVEGVMIRDCLELGSNDLKALIQVVKDLVLQFYPVSDKDLMNKAFGRLMTF